ncbi:biotin/lipoyl-binding protein, partial [Rhizobium ruizarguesonis]
GVITLTKGTFPITTILPGRAETFQTADIRPQVSGLIREVAFKDGGEIKKGDLLYQIEDAPYIAADEALVAVEIAFGARHAGLRLGDRRLGLLDG